MVYFQIKTKKWIVDLDISAPQILIPENFIDLGHLHLYNKNFKQRQDSEACDDGLFYLYIFRSIYRYVNRLNVCTLTTTEILHIHHWMIT